MDHNNLPIHHDHTQLGLPVARGLSCNPPATLGLSHGHTQLGLQVARGLSCNPPSTLGLNHDLTQDYRLLHSPSLDHSHTPPLSWMLGCPDHTHCSPMFHSPLMGYTYPPAPLGCRDHTQLYDDCSQIHLLHSPLQYYNCRADLPSMPGCHDHTHDHTQDSSWWHRHDHTTQDCS